jgi:hypothetical protein
MTNINAQTSDGRTLRAASSCLTLWAIAGGARFVAAKVANGKAIIAPNNVAKNAISSVWSKP